MTDEKAKIVPPAKVHGDSGASAVVAEVDVAVTEDDRIPAGENAQPAHNTEAGMRS